MQHNDDGSDCEWLPSPLDALYFLPSHPAIPDPLPSPDPWSSPDDLWSPFDQPAFDQPASQDSEPLQLILHDPSEETPDPEPVFPAPVLTRPCFPLPRPCLPVQSPAAPARAIMLLEPLPDRRSSSSPAFLPSKLTLGQKLDIVRRSEAPKHDLDYRSPSELAHMYGKSRSSISKILRPSYVGRLKQLAASGVSTDIRRSTSTLHPELERRIHEYVVRTARGANWRQEVCRYAERVAEELGVEGFKASLNWYHRFIARHSLRSEPAAAARKRRGAWSY
ncbi:hypothetical protein GUITHDRAFT_99657 [Guillardia theta CCMP2712]|uniref:HTH CENPB-type domain-containing protein n=1 Tax=Guillardia theta (strain CCMP2712) TaxID=905079 RepID=L1K349_GUITC|nr:hypothetical protein GUITHDRAFT_99657 [Guillardia theta CCMP2712]EKX55017.1 hypothetical protein GUITHDRAFT_99657 [Guillardia theta CCMP2712]|eukprot:XP_005841997.1 hypothetical protein GUITHDRAFT_99657 [Guillardia theta CCMP2712]